MVGRPADVVPWPARAATTATTGASRTTATSLNRATERIIGVPLYQGCWTAAAGDRICGWPDVIPCARQRRHHTAGPGRPRTNVARYIRFAKTFGTNTCAALRDHRVSEALTRYPRRAVTLPLLCFSLTDRVCHPGV